MKTKEVTVTLTAHELEDLVTAVVGYREELRELTGWVRTFPSEHAHALAEMGRLDGLVARLTRL